MLDFIKERAIVLERIEAKDAEGRQNSNARVQPFSKEKRFSPSTNFNGRNNTTRSFVAGTQQCNFCKGQHWVSACPNLIQLPIASRMTAVINSKLCINCLRPGHSGNQCSSHFRCKHCKGRHHSLLHMGNSRNQQHDSNSSIATPRDATPGEEQAAASTAASTVVSANCSSYTSYTILPTALVFIKGANGRQVTVRALLDSGSQENFMTDRLARQLGLMLKKVEISVVGIAQSSVQLKHECSAFVHSHTNAYGFDATFFVTNNIFGSTPAGTIRTNNINIPPNLALADPDFMNAGKIDLLLGSGCFWQLLSVGQHKLDNKSGLIMQKTKLGWVVSGALQMSNLPRSSVSCNFAAGLQDALARFWQLEECVTATEPTQSNFIAHFKSTHSRTPTGRFIVDIPFKESIVHLGNSYEQAKRRFLALEGRLHKNDELRLKYSEFIDEYLRLGHMVRSDQGYTGKTYYLPHHCVINESSITTKLRVVFDGSAQANCGQSLNSYQEAGPVVQDDLFAILLRFRIHKFVVVADISKMYRQVLITEAQRPLHRILWRPHKLCEIESYDLCTLTYGTRAASALATLCLEQLAEEVEEEMPSVAFHIRKSFYVDDASPGFDTEEEAISTCKKLHAVLSRGCFPLRKWASNSEVIIQGLLDTVNSLNDEDVHTFDSSAEGKTLGLQWSRRTDSLSYTIPPSETKRITKRAILSEIARVFDPLGLVNPCTVVAKIIMQELWRKNLTWDESVSVSVATRWLNFRDNLHTLNSLKIPRLVLPTKAETHMHGFCDASKAAYGACIYLVSKDSNGAQSKLLCAKSKIAPIKPELTIPRLELSAAALLARLMTKTIDAINVNSSSVTMWSDSVVALCWIRSKPNSLRVFESNRVSSIQALTKGASWRHVPTEVNPADYLSRGVPPNGLKNLSLWWQGPSWLVTLQEWPEDISLFDTTSQNTVVHAYTATIQLEDVLGVERFSCLRKLTRVTTYVFRFINRARGVKDSPRCKSLINLDEMENSMKVLCKMEQYRHLPEVMTQLTNNKPLTDQHIVSLAPFLDSEGLVRVGGRLANSSFHKHKKHPILLPGKSSLTKLILKTEHIRLLHAGPQAVLCSIRERYWPLRARTLARQTVAKCTTCKRCRPLHTQPPMGNLPKCRTEMSFPFNNCGIDYAGPYQLKTFAGRGAKIYKAYLAVFVCLSTRALHLELVTSLDTQGFMSCFRRFVARRGRPEHVYSDNGKNFVGADSHLNELNSYIKDNSDELAEAATKERIRWHFIPAYAPNFGGMWEAGVKSVKHHLKRVIGDRSLTYEDFSTLLCQIEAILNSRPISPLSTDPNDLSPLTPAHLLIGRSLQSVPDDSAQNIGVPENRLDRFQKIQALIQGFWRRWSSDYINTLQQRTKWQRHQGPKLNVGDIVILQEPNLPPLSWRLGRIIELRPGSDGIARVAIVKTKQGTVTRAVSRMCALVQEQEDK